VTFQPAEEGEYSGGVNTKTGRTLYCGGKTFKSLKGTGYKSNDYDVETGEEYWISGPRKDAADRLYGERLPWRSMMTLRRNTGSAVGDGPGCRGDNNDSSSGASACKAAPGPLITNTAHRQGTQQRCRFDIHLDIGEVL
jgi:hypothetical protein